MAVFNTKIQLPNTGGTNKNGTPVITGTNTYGDFLTPTLPTTPTNPVYTPVIGDGNSLVGGRSAIGGNLVKSVDPSHYFDGGVVGTVGGGFSVENKGGVTGEGVITGGTHTNGVSGGTSSNSGTATGTDDSTPTDTEEKPTMIYEEYIAEQKAREEEKRQAALKEAEIYKERAAADAQASYMQNMSTYGVNAETMAQMGLTGGGYSDYLNAQAYAQKRGEMQTASANEAVMKQQAESKYADNILSLDGQLVAYKEAEKAEKEQYAKSVYNTLWEAVQNPNTTYTADSIKAIAEKAGISETDIATLTGMLDSTLAKKAAAEEEQKATYSAGLKSDAMAQIEANGGMSVEYINSLKGYGLSDEDMAEVVAYNQKYTYNSYKSAITGGYTVNTSDIDTAYNDGLLDDTQYNNLKTDWNNSIDTSNTFFKYNGGTIAYEDAKTAINSVLGNTWASEELKKEINSTFKRVYSAEIAVELCPTDGIKPKSKIVDIYSPSYIDSDWGQGDSEKQQDLIKSIIEMEKAGQIPLGGAVHVTYGARANENGFYIYIGDGVFVAIESGAGCTLYFDGDKYKYEDGAIKLLSEKTEKKEETNKYIYNLL